MKRKIAYLFGFLMIILCGTFIHFFFFHFIFFGHFTFTEKKSPIMVVTPSSVSELKVNDFNTLQILVDQKGKVFLSLDKQEDRIAVLQNMGEAYGIEFTPKEIKTFELLPTFGVPMNQMKHFLELEQNEQDQFMLSSGGIPIDSTNNQFKAWVRSAKNKNKDLEIAIKADASTPYPEIKRVMSSLQDIDENRFNLITSLKIVKN